MGIIGSRHKDITSVGEEHQQPEGQRKSCAF